MTSLFATLTSPTIAELIRGARHFICFAGPGVQVEPARALADAARRLGPEMLSILLDFDERVMRMGFGSLEAVSLLREAGVSIHHSPGLRLSLVIVDDTGFSFTPTPLYLEVEPQEGMAPNALRLSGDQLNEALARLSPTAKTIAVTRAQDPREKARLSAISIETASEAVREKVFRGVESRLAEAPPVRFDLARQVRVFEPYLQYVELTLAGAAIQRHRLAIPEDVQRLGDMKELKGRLRTTFDLIEKDGKLSSKPLEAELTEIRRNFTPSLGKDHGRVVLKAAKPTLVERLDAFKKKLENHQKSVGAKLEQTLDKSRNEIARYYLPRVVANPPDALLGQLFSPKPSKDDARRWIEATLDRVFPKAEDLIEAMKLDVTFKDVTFETLNREDFLESVQKAFPNVDWDKAYSEFKAAGESRTPDGRT
jgi:hypothetical protein